MPTQDSHPGLRDSPSPHLNLPAKLLSLHPALTLSTSGSSGPLLAPTFGHLLGYPLALLCPGVGPWPWQHTGLRAKLPGEHV